MVVIARSETTKQSQLTYKQEIATPLGLDTGYALLDSGARNDITTRKATRPPADRVVRQPIRGIDPIPD